MAAVVEISKTQHLSFSPLNEKHNILYYRARQYLNQRHIQKPWFDLNPFLDKEDDKGINLDVYRPEHDKGVQPLESLTIVEDYFSENPLLTKEFKLAEFWEFLFSDDWADGYSVRILEGRLLNMVMACLVSMTHSGKIVQHSTRAYAKNRRKRYSVYKHSAKSQRPTEIGRHEETLLLEFIYYGHMIRTSQFVSEDCSSSGYVQTTSTATNCTCTSISSDSDLEDKSLVVDIYSKGLKNSSQAVTPVPPSHIKPSQQRQKLLKKRVNVTRKENSPVRDRMLINKSLSRIQEEDSRNNKIPRGTHRREHRSDVSSGSEDYSYACVPQKLDLSKFMCTEKVSYLGEFDLSDDSSSSEDEGDLDYGQGLYIGDREITDPPVPPESVETKLKKRKSVVRKNRQLRRQLIEEARIPIKPLVPEFSKLDIQKYVSSMNVEQKPNSEQNTETVPDLAEYIQMLKKDDMNDPRLAKESKRRRMKFMKKYKLIKPQNEEFADTVGGITDSEACRLHCYGQDNVWKVMSEQSKKKFLTQKLLQAGGKVPARTKKKAKQSFRRRRKQEIPLIYITTISGISYMHPVSRPIWLKRLEEEKINQPPSAPPARRRLLSLASAEQSTGNKKGRLFIGNALGHSDSPVPGKPIFPKAKPLVLGMESPDYDSDEESDGLDESIFDTDKLHIRYSLERIRKTKAERRRRARKEEQPQFFQVLRKYYRMQSILKAFTPNSRRKLSGVAGSLPLTRPRQAKKMKRNIINAMKLDEQDEMKVGKIKWFPFLDARRKLVEPTDDMDEPIFDNYPMNVFRQNVERALDEFVVRREVVISDYSAKAIVSITMTKKSVFVKSRASL